MSEQQPHVPAPILKNLQAAAEAFELADKLDRQIKDLTPKMQAKRREWDAAIAEAKRLEDELAAMHHQMTALDEQHGEAKSDGELHREAAQHLGGKYGYTLPQADPQATAQDPPQLPEGAVR